VNYRSSVRESPVVSQASRAQRLETFGVTLAFVALTAGMTWPHALVLATHAPDHQDIYFNLWRLRWIAHALAAQPASLFGGNIFFPEPLALTFSDAILVEGLLAAPLFWMGLPPVLVHNLALWAPLVGSATGMFVLARELTGSRAGAFASGLIFTFAPYRFEHYMHLELQWALWTPWAFWALHRTIATRSWRFGLQTGVFLALQMLSCIYYGILLGTLLPFVAVVLIVGARRGAARGRIAALIPGAVAAVVICGAYALPYLQTKEKVGGRSDHEILMFSARPSSYLVATPDNVVWGRSFAGRGRPERRLFPGATAVLLALIGLLLRTPSLVQLAYLFAGVAAFELSLGLSGYSFRFLHDNVPLFHGLRAMARAGLFVLFFVAILAAFGYAALASTLRSRGRSALAVIVLGLLIVEYRVRPLALVPFPNDPPPLQAWLAQQPPGAIAELPMPGPEALPGPDARYSYLSTFHWKPMLNGYSGFFPQSYLDRVEALRAFPDQRAIARLKADGARYLVVHFDAYDPEERTSIRDALTKQFGMAEQARFPGAAAESIVFLLR
jgi:hypothetical protein